MNVAHAFVRFGLGRRGGEPLPADPGIPSGQGPSSAARTPCGWPIPRLRPPDWRRCARTGRSVPRRPSRGDGRYSVRCSGPAGQCARHADAIPRAAGVVLDQPFHGLVAPARMRGGGRCFRRGGDPPARHRALRRHAARGHAPPPRCCCTSTTSSWWGRTARRPRMASGG
jgi:hypothetical protein